VTKEAQDAIGRFVGRASVSATTTPQNCLPASFSLSCAPSEERPFPKPEPLNRQPPPLTEAENLGRSVYSRTSAKRASRAKPIPEVFLVRPDDNQISVDRMDHAERSDMAKLAIIRGQGRGNGGKEFQGWAVVNVGDAATNGRTVMESPLPDNPYHADIRLNLPDDGERRERQKQHSVDLAARASWEDPPS